MTPLLLLHGALGSQASFADIAPLLAKEYAISLIDFNGHGSNANIAYDFTIEGFGRDVLDWMDKHSIETIAIFGYSMGGYVGLWLARYYPERINKLMTLGTKLDWNTATAQHETRFLNPDKMLEKVPPFAAQLAVLHGEQYWKAVVVKTATMMNMLAEKPLADTDFGLIQTPICICRADGDTMVSKEESLHVQQLIPLATYIEIADSQHQLDQVDIDELYKAISVFFA